MGTEDVLSDQMVGGGPPCLELRVVRQITDGGDIVDERVEPDVGDIVRVERQFDAPRKARLRTADAEVAEFFATEETERLLAAVLRHDEIRMLFDVVDQPVLILSHLEEVALLLQLFDGAVAIRAAAVHEILFREIAFIGNAIPTFVGGGVNQIAVVEILQNLLDDGLVALLRRADEIVVRDAETFPKVLKTNDILVAMLQRRAAGLLGGALHFLPMFVRSRQEERLLAEQAVVLGEHVGQNGRVGMADVGDVVHIVNGCGDVEVVFVHDGSYI